MRDRDRGSYKTLKDDYVSNKNKIYHGFANINYDSFVPLLDYNIECYNFHNYGHIGHYCRRSIVGPPKQNKEEYVLTKHIEEYSKVWKRMQKQETGRMKLFVMRKDVIS
jgi:hypothetical protein